MSSNLRLTTTLLCFIFLLQSTSLCTPHDDEDWDYTDNNGWKSASATYTKDTNGSIITDGACGYGDKQTTYGNYTSELSTVLFNRGLTCGACFEIRCIDHIRWCLPGSPSVFITVTDFCAPNYGLSSEYDGWCNVPNAHFEMSEIAFSEIAKMGSEIVPVQYRRVGCESDGGIKFTLSGEGDFMQVLITNVGSDGEVVGLKVKGSRSGWIVMGRNWGQLWECNVDLNGQALSFEVVIGNRKSVSSYNVAPKGWKFGETFEGKQIYD